MVRATSRSRPTRSTATSRRAAGRAKDDPLRPSSPYSAAKAGGDLQVLAYVRTYGVRASITRGANTYGPNQYPEKLVPLFVTNALEGEPLPVYGDGKQVREWLHAEDHCAGIELVLHEGAPGEIYNVGGEDHENLEVTHRILELTGADPSLIRHVEDRAGHDRRYAVDDAKLRALGWSPRALVRRGRASRHRRLVPRQPRLVGADQVGRVPRLLRRAVRKPAQGLSRPTENTSVRFPMRHAIVLLLALALAAAAAAAARTPAAARRRCRRRSRRPSSCSQEAATATASASTSTARSARRRPDAGYREILAFYYPGTTLGKAPTARCGS